MPLDSDSIRCYKVIKQQAYSAPSAITLFKAIDSNYIPIVHLLLFQKHVEPTAADFAFAK
jgi:hypothetical protein